MSDNKLDICRMPEFGIEARYEIPYDVDFLWNDGCDGSDLWRDDAETSVSLLVSKSGSAYVCPKGRDGFWRIYRDKWGRANELKSWPREGSPSYRSSDATKEFEDVLACAKTNHVAPKEVLNSFNISSAPPRDSDTYAMKPGPEVELPGGLGIDGVYGWTILFEEGAITLENDHNSDKIYLDNIPIASNTYEICWKSEHNHVEVEGHEPIKDCRQEYFPELTERELIVDLVWQLREGARNTVGPESVAMDLAARVFERACSTMLEIEAFDAACYGEEIAPAIVAEPSTDAGLSVASAPAKIIVVGDSIVASYDYLYPAIIGQSLNSDQVEVHAMGRNGDTIYRALGVKKVDGEREVHLESTLSEGYDEMILALGVNSVAAGWKADVLRDLVYDACVIAMETGVRRMVLVEIAPWKGWKRWTERNQVETMRYNEMLGELADELNCDFAVQGCDTVVEVARIYDALEDEARPGYLKYPRTVYGKLDQLHPDERGLKIIAEEIVDQMYSDSMTLEYRHEKERLEFKSM